MTPEESIKVLADYKMESSFAATPKLEAALGQGIEALKRLQKCRKAGYKFYCQLMPGETKE